jgi:hypothetical protein
MPKAKSATKTKAGHEKQSEVIRPGTGSGHMPGKGKTKLESSAPGTTRPMDGKPI